MTALLIRNAMPADASMLSALAARTFNDTFAGANAPEEMAAHNAWTYSVDIQRAEIESAQVETLIAELDGVAIAYAQLRQGSIPSCVSARPTIELWRFYVDKAVIGRGIAQALMPAVLDRAAASGANTMWLGVWEHNPRAIAFYRKFGFAEIGRQTFLLGNDPQNDLIFTRSVPL